MPLLPFQSFSPCIGNAVFIAPNAYVIGDVDIRDEANIWFGVTIRGDVNTIAIGARTNIQDGTIIHATKDVWKTRIGANVTVGHAAMLHGCTIADNVLIGMRSVVLDGAEVGEYSLIAAGSLVTERTKIPPRCLAMGVPAKMVRPLKPEEISNIHRSAQNYVDYARVYRQMFDIKSAGQGQD